MSDNMACNVYLMKSPTSSNSIYIYLAYIYWIVPLQGILHPGKVKIDI